MIRCHHICGVFTGTSRRLGLAIFLLAAIAQNARSQSAGQPSSGAPQNRDIATDRGDASTQDAGDSEQKDPATMFPHFATDRIWLSGQANFISQWHPAFHSPSQGPNSLSPEAQDATSHLFTL